MPASFITTRRRRPLAKLDGQFHRQDPVVYRINNKGCLDVSAG